MEALTQNVTNMLEAITKIGNVTKATRIVESPGEKVDGIFIKSVTPGDSRLRGSLLEQTYTVVLAVNEDPKSPSVVSDITITQPNSNSASASNSNPTPVVATPPTAVAVTGAVAAGGAPAAGGGGYGGPSEWEYPDAANLRLVGNNLIDPFNLPVPKTKRVRNTNGIVKPASEVINRMQANHGGAVAAGGDGLDPYRLAQKHLYSKAKKQIYRMIDRNLTEIPAYAHHTDGPGGGGGPPYHLSPSNLNAFSHIANVLNRYPRTIKNFDRAKKILGPDVGSSSSAAGGGGYGGPSEWEYPDAANLRLVGNNLIDPFNLPVPRTRPVRNINGRVKPASEVIIRMKARPERKSRRKNRKSRSNKRYTRRR